MINLLPNAYKQSMLFARRNTSLRGWVISLSVVLVGAVLIIAGGYLYLQNEINQQSKALQLSKSELQAQNIDGTRKQLDEISANTKLVLQVLQREILFSKLLRQLGASLPSNTALTQIQIDELKGGITLQAKATDIESATQIQVNLADPNNKIFEKADIENINCSGAEPNDPYRCTVQLKALFAKKNPYVYISSEQTTGEVAP
jgi:Tfp pilus assembly protein PilN